MNADRAQSPSRLDSARAVMESLSIGAFVATDHATVRWLLDDEPKEATGVIVTETSLRPVTGDDFAGDAREVRERLGLDLAVVGVETSALPATVGRVLGGRSLYDLTHLLAPLRSCLDEAALDRVRFASRLASRAQTVFRERLAVGVSEAEVAAAVFEAVSHPHDAPAPIVDLMFGLRCALVGMPPTGKRLVAGETALLDFAPLIDGYWSDSCSTVVVGATPNQEIRRLHVAAMKALERAIALVEPGRTVGEIDRAVRDIMADAGYTYPHLTGHGVGLKQQDYPLFSPASTAVLREGFVLAIEPGGYAEGFGVRVEHVMRVGAGGAELLTTHSLALG
ncbi:M24 family metallopeptidase [Saccharopolyspora spinosa]|uniref:Xaa-Pro aminopeptidase n=1 Tax=Saccharopolyspora spinosa TaxID=60894 RepID=A0A2N3Y0P2_SACSN|nr:M24 family metallopeptidase [Saccharopolyspora spinosa]PKW16485.1 Xaa-Pro aminopeptidase [Saccharopolyspora spinosa]